MMTDCCTLCSNGDVCVPIVKYYVFDRSSKCILRAYHNLFVRFNYKYSVNSAMIVLVGVLDRIVVIVDYLLLYCYLFKISYYLHTKY